MGGGGTWGLLLAVPFVIVENVPFLRAGALFRVPTQFGETNSLIFP